MTEEVTTQLTLFDEEFRKTNGKFIVMWRKVVDHNLQTKEIGKSYVRRETIKLLENLISEGKRIHFKNAKLDDNKILWIKELLSS